MFSARKVSNLEIQDIKEGGDVDRSAIFPIIVQKKNRKKENHSLLKELQ